MQISATSTAYDSLLRPVSAASPQAPQTPAAKDDADAEQSRAVAELRARDREVRSHEQAHQAAGGQYVSGGPQLNYRRGPDGHYYAVGGEVQISTAPVPGDPQATLRKLQAVQRAALAPAEPSAQDLKVAAQAAAGAAQARQELAREQGDTAVDDGAPVAAVADKAIGAYGAVEGADPQRAPRFDLRA